MAKRKIRADDRPDTTPKKRSKTKGMISFTLTPTCLNLAVEHASVVPGAEPERRSNRNNKGEGGLNVQREAISKIIQDHGKRPKFKRTYNVPASALVNPMAPEEKRGSRAKKVKQRRAPSIELHR
jgi:hypothetical protein